MLTVNDKQQRMGNKVVVTGHNKEQSLRTDYKPGAVPVDRLQTRMQSLWTDYKPGAVPADRRQTRQLLNTR
jgi:hypothetical protein